MPWHFLNFLPEPQGQGSLRPTFGACADGFRRLGRLGRTGLKLEILLLAFLALLDLFRFFLGLGWLHEKEEMHSFGVDAVHEFVEQSESFLF